MKIMILRERNYLKHLKHAHQLRSLMKRRERDYAGEHSPATNHTARRAAK